MSNIDQSSARIGLAHLTGLFNEIERRLVDTESKRGKIQVQHHDKISELEKSLELEVERRMTAEKFGFFKLSIFRRLAELIDTQLRLAMERLSGAFETEMNRLNRRMEVEVLSRFDTMEREVHAVNNRITRVENTISALTMAEKRNAEVLQHIEEKVNGLENSETNKPFGRSNDMTMSDTSNLVNSVRAALNEENIINYQSVVQLLRGEISELEARFGAFEHWFRDNITPELVDLKAGIEGEQKAREASTTEVVTILSKYARLMQKHFGGE